MKDRRFTTKMLLTISHISYKFIRPKSFLCKLLQIFDNHGEAEVLQRKHEDDSAIYDQTVENFSHNTTKKDGASEILWCETGLATVNCGASEICRCTLLNIQAGTQFSGAY